MRKKIFCIFLSLVLLLFFACENEKIKPGFSLGTSSENLSNPENITRVEQKDVMQMYEAVGTIRPLTQSVIESQVIAQILKVFEAPGALVQKGQILIQLDARHLDTRLAQANEGLAVAKNHLNQTYKILDETKAALDQARATFSRTKKLFESNIVPFQKLEIEKSGFLQAKARLEKTQEMQKAAKSSIRKAKEIVKEAKIARGYTKITSPASGVVVKKMIDPGDLAVPGKPLLIIQTSGALRLEANVREALISRVIIGNDYKVKIKAIKKTVVSQIVEIIPYADPATRTFLVKASLPDTPGIYPGMFGRLLIPVKKQTTLLIPQKAVIKVGQLELVYVRNDDGTWQSVYIKTGKSFDEKIEVLSGLFGNEAIGYK